MKYYWTCKEQRSLLVGETKHFQWRRWHLSKALRVDEVFPRQRKRETHGRVYSHDRGVVGMYTLMK